jgi:predicted RNA binding protein YcfA (HicA-like mRNA interferase family)
MPKLPVISGGEAVKALQRAGWRVDRQRGSHVVLLKAGHIASLSVPQHKELAPGTLRSLLRNAEMTVEELLRLL